MKKPYSREVRTKLERLQMQLDAERDRAEKAWEHMRELMYENVDLKLKLDAVKAAINGEALRDGRKTFRRLS